MKKTMTMVAAAVVAAGAGSAALAADTIPVGHLATYTGPTSDVGKSYGQGIADAMAYINKMGGINGKKLDFETFDYAYDAPRAIAQYKKWLSARKPVAIQGWGTADTEALVKFITEDKVFFMSASYSGHLTDPTGKAPKTKAAAPFNFFYGPSYSDACRGLVQWAAEDWKKKGGKGKPKYVHMGDNHPYPNAPKDACNEYAAELGFEVLPPIVYSLKPADTKAQCLSLKDSGANYAFMANTSGSNISLLKNCSTVGVNTQFMANVWGWDENSAKAAGDEGNGVVSVVGAATWNDNVPGMKTVREVSKMSDPSGNEYRVVHYMRAVCGVFYMRDAMLAADKMKGGITAENVKAGMEQMRNHVPKELEGVCIPSTWTAEDHRGTNKVFVFRNEAKGDKFSSTKIFEATIERRADWLGW